MWEGVYFAGQLQTITLNSILAGGPYDVALFEPGLSIPEAFPDGAIVNITGVGTTSVPVIPEPATLGLLAIGGLLGLRRRRR